MKGFFSSFFLSFLISKMVLWMIGRLKRSLWLLHVKKGMRGVEEQLGCDGSSFPCEYW